MIESSLGLVASGTDPRRLRGDPEVGCGNKRHEYAADRVTVHFDARRDELSATVTTGKHTKVQGLGPTAEIVPVVTATSSALRRVAFTTRRPNANRAARLALAAGARQLCKLLLAPLQLGMNSIELTPGPALSNVPWAAVAVPAKCEIEVAVPVRQLEPPRTRTGRVVLISGPGLAWANDEISRLRRVYPTAVVLRRPTVAEALAQLDGAQTAHIAAHGVFHAKDPARSSIDFADRDLHPADFARLGTAPDVTVLSSCEAARSGVGRYSDQVGLAVALLGCGASHVIAPTAVIPDDGVAAMMLDLHYELRRGSGAQAALALAARRARHRGLSGDLASAGAFVALKAGGPAPRNLKI